MHQRTQVPHPGSTARATARSMRRRIGTLAVLLALPAIAAAQRGAGAARATMLEPTSSSTMAVTEFKAGWHDVTNLQPTTGIEHLRRSLEADPGLGIARVFSALNTPGLTRAQRLAELDRGVADAARASAPELLLASALRARFQGDIPGAQGMLRSASALVPQDPDVAYQLALLSTALPGRGYTDAIGPMRALTTRFPDYAMPYNTLGYNLWRSGDHAGGMALVRTYLAKLPNEPNPHDSYAELLQWNGQLDEAVVEYRKARSLDPSFTAAAAGLAEAYVIMGKWDLARAALTDAMPQLPTPAAKLGFTRQVALVSLAEGNLKLAQANLGTFASDAKAADDANGVGNAHALMAITDALLGNGKAVKSHLALIAPDFNATGKAFLSGMAFAIAKLNTEALSAAADVDKAVVGNPAPAAQRLAPEIRALVLINQGKGAQAVEEISRTDLVTPSTRAILALAQQAAGNTAVARSLRDEILGERQFATANLDYIIARRLVTKIN